MKLSYACGYPERDIGLLCLSQPANNTQDQSMIKIKSDSGINQ
jgi:hypothetical protein